MKTVITPQTKRVLFDHNKKENFTVTRTPKYKNIFVEGDILNIDGNQYRLEERGYNYQFVYRVMKTRIRVMDITRFTKFLQTDVWNADSPFVFEFLFDAIVKNVRPINN